MITITQPSIIDVSNQYGIPLLAQEDIIYLDGSDKTKLQGDKEITRFRKYVKINKVPVEGINGLEQINNIASLVEFYQKAQKLSVDGVHYVTGVKIIFGVDDNKMCLLYRPVCMSRTGGLGKRIGRYKLKEEEEERKQDQQKGQIMTYKYNDTDGFTPILPEQATLLIKQYKELIEIKHSTIPGDTHSNFIRNYDVESVIFSFQEIFTLLFENLDFQKITIYNCIKQNQADPSFLTIKHSLLLATNLAPTILTTQSLKKEETFLTKYANLAHLCPPHCIKIVYYLLRK